MSAARAFPQQPDRRPSAKTAAMFRARPDLARAFARRGEIGRLIAHRRQYDVAIGDLFRWSIIIAELAAQKTELDLGSFTAVANGAGLGADPETGERLIDVETAMRAIHLVTERRDRHGMKWKQLNGQRVAKMLDVTAEERCFLDIRTIGAIDETKEERRLRLADEHRERDRLRKRLKRAEAKKQRADRLADQAETAASQNASLRLVGDSSSLEGGRAGETPRSHAPWIEMGISRATWYRRRKAGLEANARPAALKEADLPSNVEKIHTIGRKPDSPRSGRSLPSSPEGASCLQPRGTVLAFANGQPPSQNGLPANGPISRGCGDLGCAILRTLGKAIKDDADSGRSGFRALHEIVPAAIADYQSWGETHAIPDRRNILRSLQRLVDCGEVAAIAFDRHLAQAWRKGGGQHGDRGSRPVVVYRRGGGW